MRKVMEDVDVTVCLLNWRRPENLDEILDALAAQTVEPTIWLWNNNGEYDGDDRVDRVVRADHNWGCMARWWLLSSAEADYICTLDDDIKPADDRVLEDMVDIQLDVGGSVIGPAVIGPYGWRGRGEFGPGGKPDYANGQHVTAGDANVAVDIVKGRCMMCERELLQRVPLVPAVPRETEIGSDQVMRRCDDIYICVMSARGQKSCHVVPKGLSGRFENVGQQDGRSLEADDAHYQIRERALHALLAYWGDKDA